MVFILKPGDEKEKIQQFIKTWEDKGFDTILSEGTEHTAVCLIGNTAPIDMDTVVQTNDIIDFARRITEQYLSLIHISEPTRH